MRIRDEKGNVTNEVGFWEVTGEVAQGAGAAAIGIGAVAVLGFVVVKAVTYSAEFIVNGVHSIVKRGKEEATEETTEDTTEQGKKTEQPAQTQKPDLHEAVRNLAETAERLREDFKNLHANVEEMKKAKAA